MHLIPFLVLASLIALSTHANAKLIKDCRRCPEGSSALHVISDQGLCTKENAEDSYPGLVQDAFECRESKDRKAHDAILNCYVCLNLKTYCALPVAELGQRGMLPNTREGYWHQGYPRNNDCSWGICAVHSVYVEEWVDSVAQCIEYSDVPLYSE